MHHHNNKIKKHNVSNRTTNSNLNISGNEILGGNLIVSGNETLDGNLAVYGNGIFKKNVRVVGNLLVDNNIIFKGFTGLTGPQGFVGGNGYQGILGVQGTIGNNSIIGPRGNTGKQGYEGQQGCQGPKGDTITGPGPQGSTGEQATQGLTGSAGMQGLTGVQGPYGLIGSAYGDTNYWTQIGPTGVTGPGYTGIYYPPQGGTDTIYPYPSSDVGIPNNLLLGGPIILSDSSAIITNAPYGVDMTQFGTTTWIQNSLNIDCYSISLSSSGQYQTIGSFGYIYTSSDYGASWTPNTNAPSNDVYWQSVSLSSSGQYQTAVIGGGGIYTSSNYGQTWNNNNNASTTEYWSSISLSSSGQYQTAVITEGGIYTSSNYGQTWNRTTPNLIKNWFSVSVSSCGQYQTAVIVTPSGSLVFNGSIYTSCDYGKSWIQNISAPTNVSWYSVSLSSSGQYQTAVIYSGWEGNINSGAIFISSDYGQTWNICSALTNVNWYSVSISSSGQYQVAAGSGVGIYTSSNYGQTWSQTLANSEYWQAISLSSSGQYITAGIGDGYVYTTSISNTFGGNVIVEGTVTASGFPTSSDYRIKQNVEPLNDAFITDALKPVKYLNTTLNKNDIGFIAHELQEIYPELVTGEKDGEQIQTVNYLGLIPILINERKLLKKRIEALEDEVKNLKK
jgi:hypothetical protein